MRYRRRAFAGGALVLGLGRKAALAQGFAGLGMTAEGFAAVVPGRSFSFPADHGPHPDYRIEWWYVTANLADAAGTAYGAQWTLFRQALRPGAQQEGWANQQIWMGHAAVTGADLHRFSEAFARGGVGQAGVDAQHRSSLDRCMGDARARWDERHHASRRWNSAHRAPNSVTRCGSTPIARWCCRAMPATAGNRERGQASYYYSQPFFKVTGQHHHRRQAGRGHRTGLDGPRMEQPAAGARIRADGTGSRCI